MYPYPVNWYTDSIPAQIHGTVTFNTFYCVLVLHGFDSSQLPNILNVLNVGDYHDGEFWLYSECLKKNIWQRIRSFRATSH